MKSIIVYASHYGSSEKYASELSRRTGISMVSYKKAKGLCEYDNIIYFGSVYANMVLGLSKTMKKLDWKNKNITVVTVSLSNPNVLENVNLLNSGLNQFMGTDFVNHACVYHARGGVDYQHMKGIHKFIMNMLYKVESKKPAEERTAIANDIIETHGKTISYIDFSILDNIQKDLSL